MIKPDIPAAGHCAVTATLVAPRMVPPLSVNRTKIRFVCGTNAMLPEAAAKIAKVGVALPPIVVTALDP